MRDRENETSDDVDNGVLASTDNLETTGIGIIPGSTAQIEVALPPLHDGDDDDFVEDDVVDATKSSDHAERAQEHEDVEEREGVAPHAAESAGDEGVVDADVVDAHDEPAADEAVALDHASLESSTPQPMPDAVTTGVALTGTTRRALHHTGAIDKRTLERVRPGRGEEDPLQSRRLTQLGADRESADLLTTDRLVDRSRVADPEPEGAWQRFIYRATARRVNLGDSPRARAARELDHRIAAPLTGGAKFVPVLSRKGGVGKTSVTTLLGMALADAREDRVIAIDANPDRGTLAERIGRASGKTVRDLVRNREDITGFNDLSAIVSRDETRLDILASDADPHLSEAFSDRDYLDVASVAAHYYSIVLTDTGTGIVHSVMDATLELSDQLIVVAGRSVDEARLASETLTWLEMNGFADQVRSAVVVLNTSRPGASLVKPSELEAHFRSRVRAVVSLPYDAHIATGGAVSFRHLDPATRHAARELAALVVEGLRTPAGGQ
ncbi:MULTISPECIES: MinD/ParA family protein [unclassified Microbacterium]|uniref:MinD/ParA family ATP-binding protein n=1 Tax=unclassified Microbacterium TaxID=2609290 RepID=UPI003868C868